MVIALPGCGAQQGLDKSSVLLHCEGAGPPTLPRLKPARERSPRLGRILHHRGRTLPAGLGPTHPLPQRQLPASRFLILEGWCLSPVPSPPRSSSCRLLLELVGNFPAAAFAGMRVEGWWWGPGRGGCAVCAVQWQLPGAALPTAVSGSFQLHGRSGCFKGSFLLNWELERHRFCCVPYVQGDLCNTWRSSLGHFTSSRLLDLGVAPVQGGAHPHEHLS